jgi:single-strand DNA-binding protein
MYLSKIMLIGYVGRDPSTPFKDNPDTITFPLAVNVSWKDNNGEWQSRADWYEIMAKQPNLLTKVKKGMHLFVEGSPKINAYKNKDGEAKATISVNLSAYRFLDNKQDKEPDPNQVKHYETVGDQKYSLTTPPPAKREKHDDLDDDIPF